MQLVARELAREGSHDLQVQRLNSIDGHVVRLTRLVDDLLDVSRMRAGSLEIRPIDVNHSDWDNTLEPGPDAADRLHKRHAEMADDIRSTHAMRLGYRQAQGLKEAELTQLVANRGAGYDSVRDVWLKSGLHPAGIERLAEIDAFRSLGLDRREALWAARALNRVGGQEDLPLFARASALDPAREPDFDLPSMPLGEHVVEDYRTLGLSLRTHPAALLRDELAARRAIKAEMLTRVPNGQRVRVSGLVLVRQRPGTGNAIFMTLEDETGIANSILWPRVFERWRPIIMGARLISVTGELQNEKGVIHIVARSFEDYNLTLDLTAMPSGVRLERRVG